MTDAHAMPKKQARSSPASTIAGAHGDTKGAEKSGIKAREHGEQATKDTGTCGGGSGTARKT